MTGDRLSIRRKVYRGVEGWSITGRKADSVWPISVFVEGDRAEAVRVKGRILARKELIFGRDDA